MNVPIFFRIAGTILLMLLAAVTAIGRETSLWSVLMRQLGR